MRAHALLIGIDRYEPPAPATGPFPNLAGCVRDVGRVEAWLRKTMGVPYERITKLVAPVSHREDAAASPTYENMVAAFRRLRRQAHRGEHVWIHYSGHGGRVATLHRDVKTSDVDEALVPTDVADPQSRYLRDIELAYLLEELADAGLLTTIVLDCCHSGGAFRQRGKAAPRCRGSDHVDTTLRPAHSQVASDEELRNVWRRVRRNPRRRLEIDDTSRWRFEPQDYVVLTACRASEQALEDVYDGCHEGGALTHFLLEALAQLPRRVSYQEVYDRLRAAIRRSCPGQTPQLEGPGGWLVLGSENVGLLPGVTVLEVDAPSRKVLLNAGRAQGLRRGSRFTVCPPGSETLDDRARRSALVDVDDIGAASSWANVVEGECECIEPGAPSVLVALGPRSQRSGRFRSVRVVTQPDFSTELASAFDKVRQAISDDGFLDDVTGDAAAGESADFELAVTLRGYEIRDGAGRPIAGLAPTPFSKSRAERFASWRLVHLARFQDVLEIANHEPASPLREALELGLYRLPGRPEGAVRTRDLAVLPEAAELRSGEWVCLRIRNASRRVVNVAVLSLQLADRRIEQIFPVHSKFRPFEPGELEFVPYRVSAVSSGAEVLKAFATLEATSFRCLELRPIDELSRHYELRDFAGMEWTARQLSVRVLSAD